MGSIGPHRSVSQEFTPHLYPSLPADIKPCVGLETFSLAKLESGDGSERARLFEVCKTRGFFYLEFSNTHAQALPGDAEAIGRLAEQVFKLPEEEKLTYAYGSKGTSIFGYKQAGLTKTDAKGTPDTAEFFNCSKDNILGFQACKPTDLPSVITTPSNRSLIGRYQQTCHKVGLEILGILATELGLPSNVFDNKHRITEPSGDHVRMTRGPPRKSSDLSQPEIQTPGHTDFGTITILFNWLGGLQVWPEASRGNFYNIVDPEGTINESSTPEWLWVKPKARHAIVNLGDAAVKFTGGVLCSGRHRVVPAPDEQGLWPRYSIVYFVRPEDGCVLKRIKGGDVPPIKEGEQEEDLTGHEWIMKQAMALRDGIAKANVDI